MNSGSPRDVERSLPNGIGNPAAAAEKPLAGVVICCTAIAPEVRSRLTGWAQQMGADQRLDLTSDVTHMLVANTDTPKYRYVARERDDVVVLRPEWVEAVRSRWMNAQAIDMNAMIKEFRLPVFARLKICVTGFDDLTFRARLQQNVIENGGEYTGDLTKDVTHLIAVKPEGKKYEYATQWQTKIVSLKWYQDTLARGMQLDETVYHPSRPFEQQGSGAWNRLTQPQAHLGKRARDDAPGPEPSRKLRRTASARLGSQSDTMWTEIVGGGIEPPESERPQLRTSKSMPSIDSRKVNALPDVHSHENSRPGTGYESSGILGGKYFAIQGFGLKKQEKLDQILRNLGGTVLDSLQHFDKGAPLGDQVKILMVPHETPLDRVAPRREIYQDLSIVSEFWLEYCMFQKQFIPPHRYPLCSLLQHTKPAGFSRLRVNATGFSGIQSLHISKIISLLGGQYAETFTCGVSVLICNETGDNMQKIQHARLWKVPVVTESWLLSCMKENRTADVEKHLIQHAQAGKSQEGEVKSYKFHDQHSPEQLKKQIDDRGEGRKPGSDFRVLEDIGNRVASNRVQEKHQTGKRKDLQHRELPLQEISPNSPTKQPSGLAESKPKKRLFKTLDGASSLTDEKEDEKHPVVPQADQKEPSAVTQPPSDILGEIRDFYNLKAQSSTSFKSDSVSKKRQLQGRALSNLSNGSAASMIRQSRASSVDSVNTDGVGSEIAPVTCGRVQTPEVAESHSFTGRAKSKLFEESGMSLELGNPDLMHGDLGMEESAPPMTQLLYGDSEDTIALREKVAAKRRQRSRLGQKEDDPKPGEPKEARRIRDDDVVSSTGWGGGRRTRHKG